jgi:hypothetical protein
MTSSASALTPAQLESAAQYVAKYTAKAFRVAPEGTSDRKKIFDAQVAFVRARMRASGAPDDLQQFVWIDYRPDLTESPQYPVFEWKHADGQRNPGDTCAIPACSKGVQAEGKHYVVTGNYIQMLHIARLWTGIKDQADAVLCGQTSAYIVCHAEYSADTFGLHKEIDPSLRKMARDAVDNIGVSLCYERVSFVSDPPVGHHMISPTDIEAAWADSHAAYLGMAQQADGTWIDPVI